MRVKRARQDNSAHSEIEISMRAWHLCVRTALSGVFVVIPEISHSDISDIIRRGLSQQREITVSRFLHDGIYAKRAGISSPSVARESSHRFRLP